MPKDKRCRKDVETPGLTVRHKRKGIQSDVYKN